MIRTAKATKDVRVEFVRFHEDQRRVYHSFRGQKRARIVLRAGRRYGKTTLLEQLAARWALNGEAVGWFSPNYKLLLPSFKRIAKLLKGCIAHKSKTEAIIELVPTEGRLEGGSIEFWTLNDPDAGRSRRYHRVIIDEAGLVLAGLQDIFEQAIEPTLLDFGGSAYMAGTPKGVNEESFFYLACTSLNVANDPEKGVWTEFHVPTHANPFLDAEAIADLERKTEPLVYRQEYRAEFIDWTGVALLGIDKWMGADGKPVDWPAKCDSVFAVIDSAVKDGKEHDSTGVTYFARTRYGGIPLVILDWDITQIQGAYLEDWIPSVYARLEQLAQTCGARMGAQPPFIEDKASGSILLQQTRRRGLKSQPVPDTITAAGKDGRCFMASGPHHRGEVKISKHAYDKRIRHKGVEKNHLVAQVGSYRIGDKEAAKRADDLYDTYVSGVCLALGNRDGH